MEMIGTYELKLRCANCFKVWDQRFSRGFEAREQGFGNKYILDEEHHDIECPKCGCKNIRKVIP